jgi:hypothetical protein
MADITNPRLLWLKGALFLLLGIGAAVMLLVESGTWRTALLLAVAIWSWCRAYYFAFYVIQHYVDPSYKFAGLGSFLRYALSRRGGRGTPGR